MRWCLIALLFAAPACHRSPAREGGKSAQARASARRQPVGTRSPFEQPRIGVIPGAQAGGGSGGMFNAAGREAEYGTAGMRLDHPPPTGRGWTLGYGTSTGQVHPGKQDFNDDINVEDMTRERGVGRQQLPAPGEE